MELRKLTHLSMLLALSVVLNIVESMIPVISSVPGSKLGLANVVILFVIYVYGFKDAIYLSFMRVLLVGMIRNGLFNIIFFFSLCGGLLSVIAMYIARRFTKLSVVGVSIVGAVFHNLGQLIVAVIGLNTPNFLFSLPVFMMLSIPTGIIVGMITKQVMTFYNKINI